jgi:peptidoglycan/xylan/chitin deacetylase (PgdA/CDA1 family)
MIELASFGYHDVTDAPSSSGFQRSGALPYKLSRRMFEAHLDAFRAGGLRPVLVGDIDLAASGGHHGLLTFDDGGRSALETGEALAARGWGGHFFVTTQHIGERHFVSAGDIRTLRRLGHVIGSHSHTHPTPFHALTTARMLEEWRVSCDRIAQLLGEPCTMASVPGGDISDVVPGAAAAAGLTHLFTSEPWRTPRQVGGCWILGRYIVKAGTSPSRIGALTRFHGWQRALLARRLKLLARRTLPLPYRLYVSWRGRQALYSG